MPMSKCQPTHSLLMASRYATACSGVMMKSFPTFSMAIFTPRSRATGIAFLISVIERSKHS